MQVGLGPGHIVLGGDPAPLPPKGHSPQFSAHICCSQISARIKMPLGVEVVLDPGVFVLDGDLAPLPKNGAEPLNFRPMFIVAKRQYGSRWYLAWGRPQPRRLCVRWGPSPPPQKGAEHPIFGPRLLWPNGCMDQDGTWHGVDLSPGDFVLDGDPAPLPNKGRSPQFLAHVYCGQTAAWIKMPLGTEVDLGLRHIVLDGEPAPLP